MIQMSNIKIGEHATFDFQAMPMTQTQRTTAENVIFGWLVGYRLKASCPLMNLGL